MKTLTGIIIAASLLFGFPACQSDSTGDPIENASNDTKTVSEEAVSVDTEKDENIETNNQNAPDKKEAFDYLTTLKLEDEVLIKYDPRITEVFNTELGKLPSDDPFHYSSNEPPAHDIKLLTTKIDKNSDNKFCVVFSWGPSFDPEFKIYEESDPKNAIFRIQAKKLYINGSSSVYSEGHTNNFYNHRKKYSFKNGQFTEVAQPFYYVGLNTESSAPLTIWQSPQMQKEVARIPANYPIEVLVNQEGSNMYLVKTDFGLTGWVELKGMMRGQTNIKGLFYAGD